MKRIAPLVFATLVAATPALAEDQPGNPQLREGAEKMSEAFKLLFEGLSKEMEPLKDKWRDMLKDLEDLPDYEAPEMLPNGDIIIRRKQPLPVEPDGTPI